MTGERVQPLPTPLAFRRRLGLTLLLVVGGLTALFLYLAQVRLVSEAEQRHEEIFSASLERLLTERAQRTRYLTERCKALVLNPRIQAALEDDALDLLYPSAQDELRDLAPRPVRQRGTVAPIHSFFYRFLDHQGRVIQPLRQTQTGVLTDREADLISLRGVPTGPQFGFLPTGHPDDDDASLIELIATPVASLTNPSGIATLVVGFDTDIVAEAEITRALWSNGILVAPGLSREASRELRREFARLKDISGTEGNTSRLTLDGQRYLLRFRSLNTGSAYPPAWELVLTRLDRLEAELHLARKRILLFGAVGMLLALIVVNFIASRLASPVEALAHDSAVNASQRDQAQAALELTQAELDRAARFSANASHQLKTPLAVLRAAIDELLARRDVSNEVRQELERMVGQTQRLTDIIQDLLLLSRMDAGRLQLEFSGVDLVRLVEETLDDLSILPDPLEVKWTSHLQPGVHVRGEKRYLVHILRNLLENAQRYNWAGGTVQVLLTTEAGLARLRIGNHGNGIPADQQSHLFDRFHRAGANENVPGNGLGLSLARELARLHGGDLTLVQSAAGWTEFEVKLPLAEPTG